MIKLAKKWCDVLADQLETGMGYQITSVELNDGRRFEQAVVDSGYLTRIRGLNGIPFEEGQIKNITVTHDKWHFKGDSRQTKDS